MRDIHQHKFIGKVATYLLAIACLIVTAAWAIRAAPGDLDPTFGKGGRLTDWTGGARRVAIQPDGKIVVAGASTFPYPSDIAIARYNPGGKPDTTFGNAGKVSVRVNPGWAGTYVTPFDLAIQQDGKIVVACYDDDQGFGALVRFNPDGSFDASFGTNGVVDTGGLLSISIQPDGKIIASGSDRLHRYNSDGSPDTSFGNGGNLILPGFFPTSIIQPDGKILAAGASYNNRIVVARCNPNGSLDTTFGNGGMVTTQIGFGWSPAHSIALHADGKIVVAGYVYSATGSDSELVLTRYNPNGSLDPTFGGNGIVTTPILTKRLSGKSVIIQSNGKIVASGWLHIGSTEDFAFVRYNTDGSLDMEFGGGDGISTVDFNNSNDYAEGMALDSKGRAVVVGTTINGSNSQFALARLLLCDISSRNCL